MYLEVTNCYANMFDMIFNTATLGNRNFGSARDWEKILVGNSSIVLKYPAELNCLVLFFNVFSTCSFFRFIGFFYLCDALSSGKLTKIFVVRWNIDLKSCSSIARNHETVINLLVEALRFVVKP